MKLRNKKTGKVIEGLISAYGISGDVAVSIMDANEECGYFDLGRYKTLAELNEEWEDYKPTEPLIKDEKIRKAVRAWAELYDNSVIRVHLGEDYVSLFKDEVNGYSSSVGIDLPPDVFRELIDTHYYTIDELCGEEEE